VTYRILCAYDQSAGADKAFDFALQLAKRFDGELHVLAVFEPAEASRGVRAEALLETAEGQFSADLDRLRSKGIEAGLELTTAVSVGYPAQQILKKAEELRADHIVVGQRGKNAFERRAMGSVSLRIVSHGAGTVTVVR
jgi:nucleotide-binding universal stress UspA family protein